MEAVPAKVVELKCLVMGPRAGKTILVQRALHPENPAPYEPAPTDAAYCGNIIIPQGDTEYRVQLWEIPSREQERWQEHAKEADLIVMVWDAAQERTFVNLVLWLQSLPQQIALRNIPMIFIRNKIDTVPEKDITFEHAIIFSWAKTYGFNLGCSVSYCATEPGRLMTKEEFFVQRLKEAEAFKVARQKMIRPAAVGDNIFGEQLKKVKLLKTQPPEILNAVIPLEQLLQDDQRLASVSNYARGHVYDRKDRKKRDTHIVELLNKFFVPGENINDKKKIVVLLLLHLLSMGQRKETPVTKFSTGSYLSEFIETALRILLLNNQNDVAGFEHTILDRIDTQDFCKTDILGNSVGDIVGHGRHSEMKMVLELLRELDYRERHNVFHTDEAEARKETMLILAERVFNSPELTKEALLKGIEPKTISSEVMTILDRYYPQARAVEPLKDRPKLEG